MGTGKLNKGVAIVGAGMTKFGVNKDRSIRDMCADAFIEMIATVDKGIDINDIDAMYLGNAQAPMLEGQGQVSSVVGEWLGLTPKPVTRLESACASGSAALREGIIAIASGIYDIVLVGGVEKMTGFPTAKITEVVALGVDRFYEFPAGFTFPGEYAALATAHMHKYGTTEEQLMKVGLKNHSNGAMNPKAQFTSVSNMMKSRIAKAKEKGLPIPEWKDEMEYLWDPQVNPTVAWPLKLLDCSPISDGAAFALLVREDLARSFSDTPIYVIGSGQASDYALHGRKDMTTIWSARESAKQAYEMAGVKPEDIQLAEVHDCFTIAEIVGIEDLGFFKPGEGARATEDGLTRIDGPKPVNTSGGLKAKGHPVGASGAGQIVEIWHQMRGEAGERQVKNSDVHLALTHNVGTYGGTCTVHIYERR